MLAESDPDLVAHVARATGAPTEIVERLVEDVLAYFTETVDDFVRRRHRELQRGDAKNAAIWSRIAEELPARRFVAAHLSERQLRRMVYG